MHVSRSLPLAAFVSPRSRVGPHRSFCCVFRRVGAAAVHLLPLAATAACRRGRGAWSMEGSGDEVLFRDTKDIQPPAESYEFKLTENIYRALEPAQFVACPEDIWQPLKTADDEFGVQRSRCAQAASRVVAVPDSGDMAPAQTCCSPKISSPDALHLLPRALRRERAGARRCGRKSRRAPSSSSTTRSPY